jgi:Acetyltransferase (GNAT) family.
VGQQLLNAGLKIAQAHNYQGIYTIAQDNNLAACRFYLHCQFQIGGLNTREYFGTSQADKVIFISTGIFRSKICRVIIKNEF